MSTQFLGDEASLADLESRISPADVQDYERFKHRRITSAFLSRIFILYKPTGLTKEGTHRPPEILTQVKVTDFVASAKSGCQMHVEDLRTGEVQVIGHIPARLFKYNVFVSVAPFMRLRWDGRIHEGNVKRSLCFGVLIKQRTRSDYYSANATMMESPGDFRQLYPSVDLQLQYA